MTRTSPQTITKGWRPKPQGVCPRCHGAYESLLHLRCEKEREA